jgi:hypothetical protein
VATPDRLHADPVPPDTTDVFDLDPDGGASAADGCGGAVNQLLRAFVNAVAAGDHSAVTSGPYETLRSHQVVWAAEQARHQNTVVILEPGKRLTRSSLSGHAATAGLPLTGPVQQVSAVGVEGEQRERRCDGSVQPTRVRTTVSCSGGTALGEGPVGGP